jgi:adenylate cyclase
MQKPSPAPDPSSGTLIDDIASWLMASTLGSTPFEEIFSGCCERLFATGLPLARAHIAYRILHPLYGAMSHTWTRGVGLQVEGHSHIEDNQSAPEDWLRSPFFHIIEHRLPFLRRRLTGPDALIDFPVLEDLREGGASDYFAYSILFGEPEPDGHGSWTTDGLVGSWTSDRPGGFRDADLVTLRRIQQRLGVACKMRIKGEIAENVVTTYLGRDAGLRVLNGQIRRGDGETVRAAYWYSDLRGSTQLAETLEPVEFINILNSYFETTAGAVIDQGGEILSFIGDAVLAVFPIVDGKVTAADACRRCRAAQVDSGARLAALNRDLEARGRDPLRFGIGLHVGDAVFGNIGIPERLAFTVIGTPVNEVARLEGLTKDLGEPVLATDAFARHLETPWRSLGRHEMRGVEAAVELFAPPGQARP